MFKQYKLMKKKFHIIAIIELWPHKFVMICFHIQKHVF